MEGTRGGSSQKKTVYKIAEQLQKLAHQEAENRLGTGGLDKLKGNAKKGNYTQGGVGNNLSNDFCNINKSYSNDKRINSSGPCEGKGDRFKIGTDWITGNEVNENKPELFLPPRRQHFCTSNLENLDVDSKGGPLLGDNVSNSLLGDVLLAANHEAKRIIELYQRYQSRSDDPDKCRAVRNSFADLGDIIKGTDLWVDNTGEKETQKKMVTIFGKIKDNLPSGSNNYNDNTNYLDLRKDWWAANRSQVWDAMKCHLGNLFALSDIKRENGGVINATASAYCGYNNETPLDDYIPQRLRWLTEWSEWFCKKQKMDYESLSDRCGKCKSNDPSNGECMKDSGDCRKCTKMCNEYKDFVKDWKKQWEEQSKKYSEYMTKVKNGVNSSSGNGSEKQLEKFFEKLKSEGKDKYSTAAGYITDIGNFDCKEQKDFSDSMAGGNTYAFRLQPHEYDQACKCKDRSPGNTPNPVLEGELSTNLNECSLSTDKSAINENSSNVQSRTDHQSTNTPCGTHYVSGAGGRISKSGKEKIGNGKWECNNRDPNKSPCVPPRVQEICLGYLDNDQLGDKITNTSRTDDKEKFSEVNNKFLKEVLITARFEGQELWDTFVTRYRGKNMQENKEKACDAIRRSFHDLGDLIKGTNIWTDGNANTAEKQLSNIFGKLKTLYDEAYINPPNNKEKHLNYSDDGEFRKGWWATHKNKIWEAFNCSSRNNCGAVPTDDIPQLLRWLEEWSQEFCKERKKQLEDMKINCEECKSKMANQSDGTICKENKCSECINKCTKYKEWKNTWGEHWKKLELYFKEQKKEDDSELNKYLKDQDANDKDMKDLVKNGFDSNNCTYDKTLKSGMAVMDTPHEYSNECDCEEKLRLRKIADQNNSAGTTSEKSKICDEGNGGTWDEWDCTTQSNMCVKTNDKTTIDEIIDTVIANNNNLYDGMNKEDILFYYWFEKWLEDMERYIDKYMNYLKLSCGNDKLRNTNKVNFLACSNCKTECDCYDKLYNSLKSEWEKQKKNFQNYKNASNDAGIRELPLNYYLYARCENKLEENKKCGEMENSKNIIDTMIDDKNKEKDKLCDKCRNKKGDLSKRDKIADVYCDTIGKFNGSCPRKRKRGDKNSEWSCKIPGRFDICVPDRRNQLCITNLLNVTGKYDDNNDSLKSNILDSAKIEAQRLWDKHINEQGVLDEDAFKKDLKRSYNDYRNLVLGNDTDDAGNSRKVQSKLNDYFTKGATKGENNKDVRKEWWENHKYHVWEAMKCGIENKDKKKKDEFFLEVDDDHQIERWIKEWGDDFYEERKKQIINFGTQCKNISKNNCTSHGSPRTDVPCKDKCDKYKKWLDEKKEQWKILSEKWKKVNNKEDSNNTENSNSNMYDEPNDYLLYDCANKGCNFSDFSELLNIKGTNNNRNTDSLENKEYGQFQNYCTCIYGIDITPSSGSSGGGAGSTSTTTTIEPCDTNISTSHCNQKTFKDHDWTDMYMDAYGRTQYLNGVQIPPRRKQLCLATLMAKPRNQDDLIINLYRLAKREAQLLREKYNNNGVPNSGNDSKTCRAIKRSYGDIRDIILKNDYVDGFSKYYVDKNITETLKDENDGVGNSGGTAHSEDEIKKERKTFWEINKENIWKSMTQCDNNNNICGTFTPEDNDEFLRWLEEWYESFCEEKKEQLKKLYDACNHKDCNTHCGGNTCDKCLKQCPKYEEWLYKKKDQWKGLSKKYKELTKQNSNNGNNTLFQTATKDKSSAQVYLNILCNKECSCGHKDQNAPSNNALKIEDVINRNDEEYKNNYRTKCLGCELKTISNILTKAKNKMIKPNNPQDNQGEKGQKLKPAPSSGTEDICDKVKECIENNETKKKGERNCNPKYHPNEKSYPGWTCNRTKFQDQHEGPCMPPRRQKLCIHYLQHEIKGNTANEDKLKDPFIKCAALETHLSWEKYKTDNKDSEKQLQSGTIPEEFKRIMIYIFGDYRDLCLGKDIGKREGGVKDVKDNIDDVFKNSQHGGTQTDAQKREEWWDQNGPNIWEGMLCALSQAGGNQSIKTKPEYQYDNVKFSDNTTTNLCDFSTIPQFLRWMVEWGEDFCRHYTKEYGDLQTKCKDCVGNGECDKCTQCKQHCPKYERFINEWKKHYESQNKKFKEEKDKANLYDKDPEAKGSSDARDYLKKKLNKMGPKSRKCDYNCMDKHSSTQNSSSGDPLPSTMEYPPTNYENKCNCVTPQVKPGTKVGPATRGGQTPGQGSPGGQKNPPGVQPQAPPQRSGRGKKQTEPDCINGLDNKDKGLCRGAGINTYNPGHGTAITTISTTTVNTDTDAVPSPPQGGGTVSTGPDNSGDPNTPSNGGNTAGSSPKGKSGTDPNWWDSITNNVASYSLFGGILGTSFSLELGKTVNEKLMPHIIDKSKEFTQKIGETIKAIDISSVVKTSIEIVQNIKKTVKDQIIQPIFLPQSPPKSIDTTHVNTAGKSQGQPQPPAPAGPKPQTPAIPPEELFNIDILSSSIPVGISFALGSIALLFYMKKKPILPPTDIFHVLDIPQNDYGIPDETSTNRYVPYGKYKGKTYIYVEGDESDHYSYLRDISSSDLTSSESEYDELDINDIYTYKSPKYKTLIEVVLKPSKKTYDVQDDTSRYQKDDSYKLTDNEWNQKKQDFIAQYLQHIGPEVPLNDDLPNDNIPKDIHPNILDVNIEEKPFITQIQDRVLHDDHEVTYNINWNIPKQKEVTSNFTDNPKYVSNNIYTGIDLINDSLNRNHNVDIYDELLKRKENELYKTNNVKSTSTLYDFGNMSNNYAH
ncbi:erythrocyte membrane protein 1, PfEMP1, putative [Plasmodium sp. gorilla clade G2]|uniref:erythrocyte membrane protein 1, PfEMP1, putative n=1 Tax=Plasmodium sp. gorilla clade G2 TaxID=880535 RepID=UPI000D21CCBF|nr:erythrocyte membrane protein 1, PfEMP1, putative [Plasmodium sp. gorilla clade G2]SOV11141.1 erythrocyte membrane protein 1, PfEMP1, putative [Plasmodium sp. gorilla clade G2]